MLLDLRSAYEVAANSGSATYGVTVTTSSGAVVNPAVRGHANRGVTYKSKPQPPPFEWPKLETPTYRIHGTGQASFDGPRVRGNGAVQQYTIVAAGGASFSLVQAQAQGTTFRRRMNGTGLVHTRVTRADAQGVYDRSLWNQIEDEDQWLTDVMQVLGVAA